MNALLSFRHPLSGKWTEVEIEANTVRGAKAKVTKYMWRELGTYAFARGKWKENYFGRLASETYNRTYGVISKGNPKTTNAYLEFYA